MYGKRTNQRDTTPWKGMLSGLKRAAILMVLLAPVGCADLLNVSLPGNVTESDLGPANAETLALSIQGNLEYAWSQYSEVAAHHSDEYDQRSGNRQTKRHGLRLFDPSFQFYIENVWTPLHTTYQEHIEFAERIEGFPAEEVPNKAELLATIRAYGPWPFIALAEGMCGSPVDGGDVLGASQLFTLAEQEFTEALSAASAAGLTRFETMARVGRARARIGLEDFQGAIGDAVMVPEGFEFLVTRDANPGRRQNATFDRLGEDAGARRGNLTKNYHEVEWKGVPDPRIQPSFTGELSFDFVTEHVALANKHLSFDEDMLLASWEEAQMFIADASAQSGDLDRAREILNDFHERAGIPPVTAEDIPTRDDVIRHVIQERNREFFAESGHRMFDHNRWRGTQFEIPFLGEPGSAWPDGVDVHGERFGDTTCFPVPRNEGAITERIP